MGEWGEELAGGVTVPGSRDLWAPVAYVQTPVTAKPKGTCKAILDFYGACTKRMDLPEMVRQVADSLGDPGVCRPPVWCVSAR
ncbi:MULTISPECIES: hypothetical protein [Streptomyces]|uniref:hypothetical protein n=1 Tax=Streptomyces TaxID=1883 RepID=UPI0007CD84E8|nr:hypothetical protein A4V12_09845 [Streptomyces noursei]